MQRKMIRPSFRSHCIQDQNILSVVFRRRTLLKLSYKNLTLHINNTYFARRTSWYTCDVNMDVINTLETTVN